jgi:hypothetical protein
MHRAKRGSAWCSLKYPEHLHGFGRQSIAGLLRASGYDVVDCGDYAYRDGVHQVESEFWWPRFRTPGHRLSLSQAGRAMVPVFDQMMSSCFGSGSGLYALGRKI